MNNNLSIVQNGYMLSGGESPQILDPFAMRPYLNARGESVITEFVGFHTNAAGKKEPQFRTRKIYKNALLRQRDWELIDQEVQDVMRQPMVGVADLLSYGLTKPLGGIGVSISTYEQISDMSAASVSMSVNPKKGENDEQEFTPVSIPVPIISKPFTLDIRTLEASRRNGHEGLDTSQIRVATLKVREIMEDMVFNGSPTIKVDTFQIYGYTNHPKRGTGTATQYGGADWSAADGNAHKTIVGMIKSANAKGFFGPFGLYVNSTQYSEILALTGTGSLSQTQLDVILHTIPDLKFVRRAPKLDAGECTLVQLTKEVVDLAIGMDVTPVSWQEFGGLINEFRVMAAVAPRVKFDANDACGVEHATGC